jgi:hypothetical protein
MHLSIYYYEEGMMGETRIDRAVYESVRSYLQAALDRLLATGRSARDLVESAIDWPSRGSVPYLKELQEGIEQGRSTILSLADSARTAVFGMHISPEQRQQMIRKRAFMRAEQRGFAGEHEQEDWQAAEREVDALLANQSGIVEKARKVLQQ